MNLKVDAIILFITASNGSGEGWRIAIVEAGEIESEGCRGFSGSTGGCLVSEGCETTDAFAPTGLDAARDAGLLNFLLSFCAFLAAQLAEDGRAEPSPLSLRLIASSWAPSLVTGCDAAEMFCGACWDGCCGCGCCIALEDDACCAGRCVERAFMEERS